MQAQALFSLLCVWGVYAAPRPPPSPPSTGAVASGVWRNVFVEAGYPAADVDARLAAILSQLFSGNPANETLIYPAQDASADAAYLWSVDSNDVRTEGMSYGMMAALQVGNATLFGQLFRFWKRYLQHPPGDPRAGYSCWHAQTSGACMDANPASDGETFAAAALLFAAARWGNAGAINYTAEADIILDAALGKVRFWRGVGGARCCAQAPHPPAHHTHRNRFSPPPATARRKARLAGCRGATPLLICGAAPRRATRTRPLCASCPTPPRPHTRTPHVSRARPSPPLTHKDKCAPSHGHPKANTSSHAQT